MVRNHYKTPVPLLPSLKDVLRLETVTNRSREYLEYVTALYVNAVNQTNLPAIEASTEKNKSNDAEQAHKTPEKTDKLNGQNETIEIKVEDVDGSVRFNGNSTSKLSGPVLHADSKCHPLIHGGKKNN